MEETIESNGNKEKENGENETEENEIVENVETTDGPKVGCIFLCTYSFMKTVSVFELL